jgi:hypothetical protein
VEFFLWQALAFGGWFLYGSFFEWVFHKYLFHNPKPIYATYKAHAITHHGMYSKGDAYDSPAPEDPNGRHIMMDWFALPLFLAFHFPIVFGVQAATGIPMIWGGLAAIGVYYTLYESSHYVMHVPRGRWIERTRAFKFLNDHHRRHHVDPNTNLNVVLPVADKLLGTLWLKDRPARAVVRAARRAAKKELVS